MDTRTSDFHFFLKTVGQRFTSISIFNSDFKCLYINTPYSNNSVGLMQGLKSLKNFFIWDGSQVVVHNDPFLGCGQSDRIQFLFSCESFHFCIEENFNFPWDFSKKIIKIPPIPVVENHRINEHLLQILTGQPDCPVGLQDFFQTTIKKIEKFQHDFKNTVKSIPSFSSKDVHKDFLSASANCVLSSIKSKTYSISQIEYEFEPYSLLKLKTTTSELGIRIDFQGTTSNSILQLSDYATDSICFNFFADYFQFTDLMNESTYSHFQIAKPTHSFVNSKIFTSKFYSDLCGADLINQALLDCLSERLPAKPFLSMKPYYQVFDSKTNQLLEFAIPNATPLGSLRTTHLFEPLLCSRPIPSGFQVPVFSQFNNFGFNVNNGQFLYRSPKSKEINDYQAVIGLECTKSVILSSAMPLFPVKVKSVKNKSLVIKPALTVNGSPVTSLVNSLTLNAGDILELKSGVIDFS